MRRRIRLGALVLGASMGILIACGSFGTGTASGTDASGPDGSVQNNDGASDGGDARSLEIEDAGPVIVCPEQGEFEEDFEITGTSFKLDSIESARRAGSNHIYLSGRPPDGGVSKMFSMVLAATEYNTDLKAFDNVSWPEQDVHAAVFDNERRVIFETKRGNQSGSDKLAMMRRSNEGVAFSSVDYVDLDGVQASDLEEPYVVNDRVYLAVSRAKGAAEQIWSGKIDVSAGRILAPIHYSELASKALADAGVGHPVVLLDQRKIYFSVLLGSNGKRDIYVASRAQPGEPWGDPKKLGSSINTDGEHEHPTWISDNDCELLYISGEKLMHAKRVP